MLIMSDTTRRIEIIDAVRGFAVVMMVAHHALYNSAAFLGAPWWVYRNPVFDVLQPFFVGLFVLVSGISSRFSRGNIERGAICIVFAVIITYVTTRMEMPITFGILHKLGLLMIFYGLTRKFWDKLPEKVAPTVYVTLILSTIAARIFLSPTSDNLVIRDLLSVLGWHQPGFVSFDYQPILPGIFIFLLGTWAGKYVKEEKFPKWFYEKKFPVFPIIGRNALAVYIIHQPILFSITMLIAHLMSL
jgi:uncharacterized membrane protein